MDNGQDQEKDTSREPTCLQQLAYAEGEKGGDSCTKPHSFQEKSHDEKYLFLLI